MPRFAVPVTRWMMNGTVLPWSVVVGATASDAGGLSGLYAVHVLVRVR